MPQQGFVNRILSTCVPELRLQVRALLVPKLDACRRQLEEDVHDLWVGYVLPPQRNVLFSSPAVTVAKMLASSCGLAHFCDCCFKRQRFMPNTFM
eukprot:6469950-Amphidinium_carterae.1